MVKRQKWCSPEQDKTVLHFHQYPSAWWYDSPTLTVKALAFAWTAHWPLKTSLVRPPNPVTTSFSESIHRDYSETGQLIILSCLDYCSSVLSGLPAFSVHSLQCIQSSAACLILKNCKTVSLLYFNLLLAASPTHNSVQDKHSLL